MKDDGARGETAAERDIAAVNLLRLRGDLEQARQLGSAMLKKHPNDATLYELMGAVHNDLGEREQALQWWEMALDIDPSLSRVRQQIESAQRLLESKETAETADRLGIPNRSPVPWALVAATVAGVAAVGYAAYVAGTQARPPKPEVGTQQPVFVADESAKPGPPAVEEVRETPAPTPAETEADVALLNSLTNLADTGVVFVAASHDPRGPSASVTVVAGEQTLPATALRAALAVVRADGRYASVQVRIVRDRATVFLADASSGTLASAAAAIAGGDSYEAQAEVALSRTWSPAQAPAPSQPGTAPN
jgi:hypothetical protein